MARWWLPVTLAMVVIAGCIQAPEDSAFEADSGPTQDAAANETQPAVPVGPAPLAGQLVASLANTTVNATDPFNLTISYEGDNEADPAMLAWDVVFTPEDETAESRPFNGTGLPATITVNLTTVGNTTLTGSVTDGHTVVEMLPTVIAVVVGDPCAGAAQPEAFVFAGLWVAVAVDGTGLYQPEPFTMPDCVTSLFVEVSSSEAYLDPMLRLKDDTGATVDNEDNEFLYHETLTYEAEEGYLVPGEWQLDLRGYLGAPGNYEGTITFNPVG